MIVKVMINRRFKEGQSKEFFAALNNVRAEAMNQKGYISGETLIDHEDPQEVLIISTWHSIDNWLRWKDSDVRKEADAMLEQYQEGSTDFRVYVLGAQPMAK